jgi:exonuclease III
MKLISLNAWGCRIKEPIFDYIQKESESTDIFCFQEILKGGNGNTERGESKSSYEDISKLLPNHTGHFSEYGEGGYYAEPSKDLDFQYGIACFIKNSLKQSFVGGEVLYDPNRKWNDYSGNFAAGAALAVAVEDSVIVNVHGLWQGSIKEDTEAKIEQSKQIMNLANLAKGRKIICGDFNLLPHTKSIQMLGNEYTDLINKYDIKSTRSSLYTKTLRYSDYAFTDKNIIINDFSVPDLNVSDHLPLILDFITE